MRVWGLGVGVSGFGVWGLGFGVWSLGVQGLGLGVWGVGCGVWGVGLTAAAGRFEPPAKSEKAPAGAGRMLLDGLILILFVCLFVWVWFVWVEG